MPSSVRVRLRPDRPEGGRRRGQTALEVLPGTGRSWIETYGMETKTGAVPAGHSVGFHEDQEVGPAGPTLTNSSKTNSRSTVTRGWTSP
jgi:hypothetical protein